MHDTTPIGRPIRAVAEGWIAGPGGIPTAPDDAMVLRSEVPAVAPHTHRAEDALIPTFAHRVG